jgi:trk system potassium uptake protein
MGKIHAALMAGNHDQVSAGRTGRSREEGRPGTFSGFAGSGTHVGDRRLRVARRPQEQRVELPPAVLRRRPMNPAVVFVLGFAGFIAVGTLLLLLPIASAAGEWTPLSTALFTATSAVCVTGLVVVDTGTYWSGFGQWVILLLVKVGGFGFMTSSTLLLLLIGREATLRERILLKEALGSGGLDSVRHLAKKVILFTLAVEGAGAILLALWSATWTRPLPCGGGCFTRSPRSTTRVST